jgi:hypothetical protein
MTRCKECFTLSYVDKSVTTHVHLNDRYLTEWDRPTALRMLRERPGPKLQSTIKQSLCFKSRVSRQDVPILAKKNDDAIILLFLSTFVLFIKHFSVGLT